MSGSISAELSAAQAASSAASQVLQVRDKFNANILAAGQKRGEEVDRAMLASLTSELDKAIADAKILGDQIAMAVAGIGLAVTASGYLNSNDVDQAKTQVRDGWAGKGNVPGRLQADPKTQQMAVKSIMEADPSKIKDPDERKKLEQLQNGIKGQMMQMNPDLTEETLKKMKPEDREKLQVAAFKELAKQPQDPQKFLVAAKIGSMSDGERKALGSTLQEKATTLVSQDLSSDAVQAFNDSKNPFKGERTDVKIKERVTEKLRDMPTFTSMVLDNAPKDSELSRAFDRETNARVKEVKDQGHQKRFGSVDKGMMEAMGALAQIQAQMMVHEKERQKATRLMSANAISAANLQG